MHTVNLLVSIVEHHQILVYFIIYLGLIFEGEFTVITTGILAHLGALNLQVSLIFILLGGFSKTFLGYALGEFLHHRYHHHRFFQYLQKRITVILPRFKERPFWSIFISKFIMGVNYLVIVFAGFEQVEYKKFLKAEIFSTLIWAPVLLFLGYVFGYTALHISHEIWKFTMAILVLFIIFILFDKLVSWLFELSEEFYADKQ